MSCTASHIIVVRPCTPRPVSICPPGNAFAIPTPAMLTSEHVAGGVVYSCEVSLYGELPIIVLPAWVKERAHVPAR